MESSSITTLKKYSEQRGSGSVSNGMNHEPSEIKNSAPVFGFWLYLMSDCLLFAALFATYVVLSGNTFGGAGIRDIANLPYVLGETFILLTSSFMAGAALLAAHQGRKRTSLVYLALTLALGIAFLGMEVHEFVQLIAEGNGPSRSGFLSAFFTLLGTHGLHVAAGALWMLLVGAHIVREGVTQKNVLRLTLASLFWHFLDLIWIFIFTIVYLMGAI